MADVEDACIPEEPVPVPAGDHNAVDVSFAQQMIPHHRQALAMAELADTRAASPQVKALAMKIKAAQNPEIIQMSAWLSAWGQQVPTDGGMSGMPGMTHSMAPGSSMPGMSMPSMPGMMGDGDMAKLQSLSGAEFDKAFLAGMIAHHEGAVTMAKDETAKGTYEPAKKMAESISTSQAAEIAEMKQLLGNG
ncbi:DUF305 domain-containing protein [Kitasatospora sp. NPDC098652]|uniref:DUF305 domain-containing protein n=1 Tax=Kitasatospora sp. NPDC098652 TaxID=3364095 RepID=UPI0037FDD71A